jgi:hypothetical protein
MPPILYALEILKRGTGPKEKIGQEWLGFPPMRMADGYFPLPDKPGLGFEVLGTVNIGVPAIRELRGDRPNP